MAEYVTTKQARTADKTDAQATNAQQTHRPVTYASEAIQCRFSGMMHPDAQNQNISTAVQRQDVATSPAWQPASQPNRTGLPNRLKTGIENLSGYAMDDVKVHYNSGKPAQLHALAYTQGNEIHLASGQQKHLPHEAWHVVQQKQGRVKPTLQMKGGVNVNDDAGLEREADVMGGRAVQAIAGTSVNHQPSSNYKTDNVNQMPSSMPLVQRKIGFEFQAYDSVNLYYQVQDQAGNPKRVDSGITREFGRSTEFGFDVTGDYGKKGDFTELEIVTDPVEETEDGKAELIKQIGGVQDYLLNEVKDGQQVIQNDSKIEVWKDTAKPGTFEMEQGGVSVKKDHDGLRYQVKEGGVNFHPQATVGVKFESIYHLMGALASAPFLSRGEVWSEGIEHGDSNEFEAFKEHTDKIGWSAKADQQPFRAAVIRGLQNANEDFGEESPILKSFASMFYGFIEISMDESINPGDLAHVKYFMPFMLRLGMLPHWKSLKKEDKEKFIKTIGKRTDYMGAVVFPLVAGGGEEGYLTEEIPEEIPELISDEILKLSPELSPELISELGPELSSEEISEQILELIPKHITWGHVIDEINEGQDYLETDGYPIAGYGAYLRSRDKLKMKSDVDIGESDSGDGREGALIELRKLGADVPSGKLLEFAQAVFELIDKVNKSMPDMSAYRSLRERERRDEILEKDMKVLKNPESGFWEGLNQEKKFLESLGVEKFIGSGRPFHIAIYIKDLKTEEGRKRALGIVLEIFGNDESVVEDVRKYLREDR